MRIRAALVSLALTAAAAAQTKKLDTTQFIVMGEGLAAGVTDFGIRQDVQEKTFGALIAKQMRTNFPQPLFQGPGVSVIPGLAPQPAILPTTRQTTVREGFPPSLFVFNLSVPGMRMADAIGWRPSEPLVQPGDPRQTALNLTLGYPALILGKGKPVWTQLEYAVNMNPTLVIVSLGYHEAADAAASGAPELLPDAAAFRANLNTVLTRLKGTFAEVIVATVPDPFDTAYFTTFDNTPKYTNISTAGLTTTFGLQRGDFVTPTGLLALGNQALTTRTGRLPGGSFVRAATADAVRARIRAINTEIGSAAQQNGATLYDMAAFFRGIRTNGYAVGTRVLTADYLGGFYTLSGFYPGITGHALIANELLALLNRTYGTNFAAVNVAQVSAGDPARRRYQPQRAPAGATQEKQ